MFSLLACCLQPADGATTIVIEKESAHSVVSTDLAESTEQVLDGSSSNSEAGHMQHGPIAEEEEEMTKAWTERMQYLIGEWETDEGGRYTISQGKGKALRYVEEDLPMSLLKAELMPDGDFLEGVVTNEVDEQLVGHLRLRLQGDGIMSWFRPPLNGAEWFSTGVPALRAD